MTIAEQLNEDMKAAMKSQDKVRLSTIRQLRSQLKDAQIAKGAELTEDDVIAALTNAAKRRKEAIEMYEKGGRADLVEAENRELEIIQAYLPKQLSDEELAGIISQVIAETGASHPSDLGRVMGKIMAQVRGRADGKVVQQMVREKLQ